MSLKENVLGSGYCLKLEVTGLCGILDMGRRRTKTSRIIQGCFQGNFSELGFSLTEMGKTIHRRFWGKML